MAKLFSKILYDHILQEPDFLVLFNELLVEYTTSLIKNSSCQYNKKYNKLLRYADLLSISECEQYHNIAQQIVIILSQLYPSEDIVKLFKEKIYKNVSNFVSISLLEDKNLLINTNREFMGELAYHTHKIQNKIPSSEQSFFDTQLKVFNSLAKNQYYSFSAPTSMGKTFVITKFILNELQQKTDASFVILVPTRALISEIANKLIVEFKNFVGIGKHRVVTTLSLPFENEKFIAVLTPERLYYSMLKNKGTKFQYLFIDEAHKISSRDKRSILYYKILDMLKKENSVRIYFSSPVIPNPDIYLKLTNYFSNAVSAGHSFVFSPVTQNKIYINLVNQTVSVYNPILKDFIQCVSLNSKFCSRQNLLFELGKNKCNLIYVSSISKAIEQALALKKFLECKNRNNQNLQFKEKLNKIAQNIEQKIHKEYYLADLVRHGIAYHIGTLPHDVRTQIEELLRTGYIRYCFCTSTLLEGVNVPVDNLFIFDHKKGPSTLSAVDAFNLMGRAGRVSLNEFGNVFVVIDDSKTQDYFNNILLKKLPNQTLLPHKAISKNTKQAIVNCLLEGKTNLVNQEEKYQDKQLSAATYEYAAKCLNMLLHDICTNNRSYIVKDFEEEKVLSPQNIIDIKNIFKGYDSTDDDINISMQQKISLYHSIKNKQLYYPMNFDYNSCIEFLRKLSDIFLWPVYEKDTLGKGNRLRYYSVILLQWMQGKGLHEIIRHTLEYNLQSRCQIQDLHTRELVPFNNSIEHKNIVINNIMRDIENIINYKFSMYFLRFTETYLKCHNLTSLPNDWYEYVEYGTCNNVVIMLQKIGFLREEAIILAQPKLSRYISNTTEQIYINPQILENVSAELKHSIENVKINYPEIFKDCK